MVRKEANVKSLRMRAPVRNFKCPFCGSRMPTEQYKFGQPWKCPSCSRPLQFSEAYGYVVEFLMAALIFVVLYALGVRGWYLLCALVLWFPATVIVIGPLHRIIPPRLEPYRPIEWQFSLHHRSPLTLFPPGDPDQVDNQEGGPPDEPKNVSG